MMDVIHKLKKASKRNLQNEDETSSKKAKINVSIEEETEDNVADKNADFENNNTKNIYNKWEDGFNEKSLKTLLSSIDDLKKFVIICNENKERDFAAEYLLAGGNIMTILQLCDSSDKKNIANATTIFSATTTLLMKIIAKYPQYQNSATEACRHLLNSYMSIVHSMLSIKSNTKQRKVALKLLTAIISLGGSLSKELLAHLSLQQQVLESLVQHSKRIDPQSVRICFIHFILAFLVDENISVIRTLLDKCSLISFIFPDLIYDSKEVVSLVLTTVKTYVLENINISKTIKLHVFSTSTVLNLVSLYNWKGPNNWKSKNKIYNSDESQEFLADKKIVNDVVHEFLITLLTSHRHGIIFHDRTLGNSRNKHNQLVHTVLQNLEKPWEHEKPSDLVIKIMIACPDLIRSQYSTVEPFLEPRVSLKWIHLIRFIKKIIESINLTSCIKSCSLELTANNVISTLLSLTVPTVIMKNAILSGINHDSLLIRHEILILFLTIVRQLKDIFLNVKAFYKTQAVQNQITDFILRTVPNLETFLRVWNRAFETDADLFVAESAINIQNPELLDHLDIILSILHLYKNICPELLEGITDLQPSVLLSNLNNLRDDCDNADGTMKIEKINCMKIKAIQFLLTIDYTIFAPGKKIFKEALCFLISLFRRKAPPECYDTTRTLLNVTGLFEACDDQLDIWINGFSVITDPKENEELIQWFMSILKSAINHVDKYMNSITQAERTISERMVYNDIKMEDIINELFDKANEICSFDQEFSIRFPSIDRKLDVKNGHKFNEENSRNIIKHINKYVTLRNEHLANFDVKATENLISETGKMKNYNNSIFNVKDYTYNVADFDIEKTNIVINNPFKFHEGNLNFCRVQACMPMSPLLYCALRKIGKKSCPTIILAYLSHIMVHTLHQQVDPELLIHISRDLINLPVYKYLRSWSNENQPVPLKNKLPSLKLHKMSNMLFTSTKVDISEILELFGNGHSSSCCFTYGDETITVKHSLSLYDVKALIKMTVFYLTQLTQRGILQQVQSKNYKLILIILLNIAYSMDQENKVISEESVKYIFTHPIILYYFLPFCEDVSKNSAGGMITQSILEICKLVVQLEEKYSSTRLYNIFSAFNNKFLVQLRNMIEKNSVNVGNNQYDIALAFLKILPLKTEDVTNLLLTLMKLEKTVFISSDNHNLSIFGYIVPVLLEIFCNKESKSHPNQCNILDDQFVTKLSLHLVYIKSNKISVQRWEQTLAKYLSIFPNNIIGISNDIFTSLLIKDITTSTIQLITTMITKNTGLIPSLVKYILKEENAKKGDIIFPILGSNLKYNWSKKFLYSLYKYHCGDIAAYLIDPRNSISWIEENTAAVAYLIENTFELTLCEKTCEGISQSGDKLDMVSTSFVQLLESLYKRYESLITVKKKSLMDLIKILLYVMTATLKKESKNIGKIKVLCEKLDNTVARLRQFKCDFIFDSLSKSYSWPQFTRFSLKLGLKDAKDDETQSCILKNLSNLCDIVYEDNVNDEYTKTLFEMTTSHSEFVNVMLGSSNVKDHLVELLRVLTRKNHSVMIASHVPLYLAAYNATLNYVDQRILQILQHYEAHNIKIEQYWPYLWGSAAAMRYSVKEKTDTALWRQPSTSEIFNLFDKDIINDTIRNYPIYRALKNNKLHESNNVYDPAFYLPLLCSLLAENNVVACHKINQSGALALALTACCSDSSDVRMTAYTIISRYYFHLEASRSKEKLLWMRLIDALRNGIVSLKCPLKDIRLSRLTTIFLARTSLVASQPLHPLYSPLHTFLMAKPALDLNTIPELLQLLHSSHVEHKAHRHWILENIRDGIKEENEVDVVLKCMLFKMLLNFYTCILSDTKTKKLILEIIASTTRVPRASLLLTRGYGIISWLHETVNHLDLVCETEIDIIITIIENLLDGLDNLSEDATHYKFLLFNILSQLRVHFSIDATNDLFTRCENIVQRIIMTKNVKNYLDN